MFLNEKNIYYKYKKLKNGQVAFIGFQDMNYYNFKGFNVMFCISNKRKQIRRWINLEKNDLNDKITGNCGIEGLIWAKQQINEFEKFAKKWIGQYEYVRLEISGSDSRRTRVYRKALKDYRYSPSEQILYKKIKR